MTRWHYGPWRTRRFFPRAILLLEVAAAAMSGMRRGRERGLVFLNFKAAFPSIRHNWIFVILR